jgi:ribosomal-protein-alanine N-acetyltransferase
MLELNFTPFPVLVTEHLNLRQIIIGDQDAVFTLRSDESVNRYIQRKKALSVEDAQEYIHIITRNIGNNEAIVWGVSLKQAPELLIGTICLWNISREKRSVEIGYELLPAYQGKGIMQEALPAVIQYGFDIIKTEIIEAVFHKDNLQSARLLEKNHFRPQAINEASSPDESMKDMLVYILRKSG